MSQSSSESIGDSSHVGIRPQAEVGNDGNLPEPKHSGNNKNESHRIINSEHSSNINGPYKQNSYPKYPRKIDTHNSNDHSMGNNYNPHQHGRHEINSNKGISHPQMIPSMQMSGAPYAISPQNIVYPSQGFPPQQYHQYIMQPVPVYPTSPHAGGGGMQYDAMAAQRMMQGALATLNPMPINMKSQGMPGHQQQYYSSGPPQLMNAHPQIQGMHVMNQHQLAHGNIHPNIHSQPIAHQTIIGNQHGQMIQTAHYPPHGYANSPANVIISPRGNPMQANMTINQEISPRSQSKSFTVKDRSGKVVSNWSSLKETQENEDKTAIQVSDAIIPSKQELDQSSSTVESNLIQDAILNQPTDSPTLVLNEEIKKPQTSDSSPINAASVQSTVSVCESEGRLEDSIPSSTNFSRHAVSSSSSLQEQELPILVDSPKLTAVDDSKSPEKKITGGQTLTSLFESIPIDDIEINPLDNQVSTMDISDNVVISSSIDDVLISTPVVPIVAAAPVRRSLRPGGGSGVQQRLNLGPSSNKAPAEVTKQTYSRDELLQFRPVDASAIEKPAYLVAYSTVSIIPHGAATNPETTYSKTPIKSTQGLPPQAKPSQRPRGDSFGQNFVPSSSPSQQPPLRQPSPQLSQGIARDKLTKSPGDNSELSDQWRREGPPKEVTPSQTKRKVIAPAVKELSDPLEKLTCDVRSILNKITPQNFDKLTNQIYDMKISTSEMLDRLVDLIFEKAVHEQSFSNLYATLCHELEKLSSVWQFVKIVFDVKSNSFFWMKDLPIDNIVSGPYKSGKDCINALTSEDSPSQSNVPYKLELREILLVNGEIIVKIFKNVSNSAVEQFFGSSVFLREIDTNFVGKTRFSTAESATKDAKKKHGIKSRLLTLCQNEFMQSSDQVGKYGELDAAKKSLDEKLASLNTEEISYEKEKIEELHDKMKRRMLGNIRFIGELYMHSLMNTDVMFICTDELLGVASEDSPKKTVFPSEESLEVLCKLLQTVGKQMEGKIVGVQKSRFERVFSNIFELSQNRRLISRIRFSLEEVLSLRRNGWVARRVTEGPVKIDEIHMRAAEEARKSQQQFHPSKSAPYAQQQSYQQHQSQSQQYGKNINNPQRGGQDQSQGRDSNAPAIRLNATYPPRGASGAAIPLGRLGDSGRGDLNGAAKYGMSTSEAGKLAESLVDDYLRNGTFEKEALFECPPEAVKSFITKVIQVYVETNKPDHRSLLLRLIGELGPYLLNGKGFVFEAISQLEGLATLTDYILDHRQAPEHFKEIFGVLMNLGVVDRQSLQELFNNFNQSLFSEDEAESIKDIYQRLL